MSVRRAITCFVLGAVLCGAAGDAAPRWSPAMTASSRAGAAADSLPPFVLFGWVAPPAESTTAARLAEYAGCGLDVALPAWADSGHFDDNAARMAWAAAVGVRCIAWEERFMRAHPGDAGTPALLDSIASDYRDRPGFFGYYLGDEPPVNEFPLLSFLRRQMRARDPAHPSFNNLLGRMAFATRAQWEAYVRAYADTVHPALLCDDHYDFLTSGDRGQFAENLAGLRALSREYGVPFWVIVQLVQHTGYRALTEGELRWQTSMALAYGARGIGYFTYWTPAPDPLWNWQRALIGWDGARGPWYDVLAAWNPRLRRAGETLARLAWLASVHAGSVPAGGVAFAPDQVVSGVRGRAAIGWFADSTGRRHALVVNADSLAPREIVLEVAPAAVVMQLDLASGAWHPAPVAAREPGAQEIALALGAGEFALLRFEGTEEGSLAAGGGGRLTLRPVPASGEVRLSVVRAARGARLEILDAAGRRVWVRALGTGLAEAAWRGERDDGGAARAGVYFARFEDAAGVSAKRFVWLGR